MTGRADRCSLCGDEAVPAVVRVVHAADATAEVEMACESRRVALDLLDAVAVGDTVLVHQGFAIARVEAE